MPLSHELAHIFVRSNLSYALRALASSSFFNYFTDIRNINEPPR